MGPIIDEDLETIREFILLPILLSVFERDKKNIEQSTIKIPGPYIELIDAAMDRITTDVPKVKAKMRTRGIKVGNDRHTDYAIAYEFLCRGYRDIFQMRRELVKAETEVRMRKYLSNITLREE